MRKFVTANCKAVIARLNSVTVQSKYAYAGFWNYFDGDDGTTQIFIRFIGKSIQVTRKVYRIDINTFVSSVGGSMGLFLGFSIYSSLLTVGKHISQYFLHFRM